MLSCLQTYLPCAIAIIKASTTNHREDKTILCKSEWSALISVMSSPSPACATIHPSERVSSLLTVMENSDITKDTTNLKVLQEEIPVIFNLIRSLRYYPKEILAPLLSELSRVAFAAFSLLPVENIQTPATLTEENKVDLAYFPSLHQVRVRGVYQADKKASGHGRACKTQLKTSITTARNIHHHLLPTWYIHEQWHYYNVYYIQLLSSYVCPFL